MGWRRGLRGVVIVAIAAVVAGCARPSAESRPVQLRLMPTERSSVIEPQRSVLPTAITQPAERVLTPLDSWFDTERAIADASAITAFGVRVGGSREERRAAEYVAQRLREMGYEPALDEFRLPNGRTSVNVTARSPGTASKKVLLLGAHTDTKPPAPGANDNASGCAVLLEIARVLKKQPAPVSVDLVFWGTEEFIDRGHDHHHLGSRHHAAGLSAKELKALAGVISVDMVGVGSRFHVRTMNRGPQSLRHMLLDQSAENGSGLSYLKDPGPTGWSDHEPYERKGIPAVWLQWQSDPAYHTARDTADKLRVAPMKTTGVFLLRFVYGLDRTRLAVLARR